ncbi:MAG: hypothetical protein JWM16_3747 [Verrucomicrobiales bacterium]|nr:hypothetical protein [Verrucomicrobiales bacterium]
MAVQRARAAYLIVLAEQPYSVSIGPYMKANRNRLPEPAQARRGKDLGGVSLTEFAGVSFPLATPELFLTLNHGTKRSPYDREESGYHHGSKSESGSFA